MNKQSFETCGHQFNLQDYFRAQEKTKQLVLEFSKMVTAGMNEIEARTLLEKLLDDSSLEKRWHPTKLRMGINTTRSFREESVDYILQADDIFFVDIGPVYYNHEGDYGETFTVGNNPRLESLALSAKTIFQKTQNIWREKCLTGHELYAYAEAESRKMNLKLNTNMYGHRLGDFPHALYSREKLGNLDFSPAPKLWVLEIHLIDEEINRGSFFEDILY